MQQMARRAPVFTYILRSATSSELNPPGFSSIWRVQMRSPVSASMQWRIPALSPRKTRPSQYAGVPFRIFAAWYDHRSVPVSASRQCSDVSPGTYARPLATISALRVMVSTCVLQRSCRLRGISHVLYARLSVFWSWGHEGVHSTGGHVPGGAVGAGVVVGGEVVEGADVVSG